MDSSVGVTYIAIGEAAQREARASINTLQRYHSFETYIITDAHLAATGAVENYDPIQRSRWAKVNLNLLSPFDVTLYLDADTRIYGDLSAIFGILWDNWDMAIVPSENQESELFWHVGEDERRQTLSELGESSILQLQGGVIGWRKNAATDSLFDTWREEWLRYEGQDQAALARALRRSPVRLWLLGRPWNGGAVIGHLFGRARQKG